MSSAYRIFICFCLLFGTISTQQGSVPIGAFKGSLAKGYAGSTSLAKSIECAADIQKYCVKKGATLMPNIKVLGCIDDLDNAVNLISKDCQNLIYKYKYNITHDVHFDDVAKSVCKNDLKLLQDCNSLTNARGTGRLASCLYESLKNITEMGCRNFVIHLQVLTFSDWRLSEYFATACMNDITDLKCGRLDDENDTLPHEQGAVIACLSHWPSKLSKTCSKEIQRLTEIQSNDYNLDRALYYACREDRERFCPTVQAGDGRVYRCLYEQKLNNLMSPACRKEIQRRQKVVVTNARVDAPLMRACQSEAVDHQCLPKSTDSEDALKLVNLLLCLEDRRKKGQAINEQCQQEMLAHRRMLMTDYTLSPEILTQCEQEIIKDCARFNAADKSGNNDQRGGKMIHCLFRILRQQKNLDTPCAIAVKTLVRAINPGNDIRADPLLENTCRPVIDALCPTVKAGTGNVILCLLENLKHAKMTNDCEDRLMDVAYFMQRDWRITPTFLRSCKSDLESLCRLPKDWSMASEMSDVQVGKYLGCLHEQRPKLATECRDALKRLMFIRTQSVGLMPEIEANCIDDLATCENIEVKGQEMKCLQRKYHELESQCKTAVKEFTTLMMADPTLDFYLMKACEPLIQTFCAKNELDSEEDVLRCLVKLKNNPKMTFNCRASIEHHQITSLKDKAFLSQQFQERCADEIRDHCAARKTKASTIQCLANLALKDALKHMPNAAQLINDKCRDELKFELLQRSESIALDPGLSEVCGDDIRNFCASKSAGNAQVLECLKVNENKLSKKCKNRLRKREKVDVIMPNNDYTLTAECGPIIQKYCGQDNKQNILLCLRRQLTEDRVPSGCRRVLYRRLMIFNTDYRFNQALIDNCQNDINKFCEKEITHDDDQDDSDEDDKSTIQLEAKDVDMGGRVIQCLRNKYANSQSELETSCVRELTDVIQTSKLDIKLDVKLYENCRDIVEKDCLNADKEDCLKLLFQNHKISNAECRTEVLRIIQEGQADIHVDHALAFSCQNDINTHCNDIPIGSAKQLQCLLKKKESVSKECKQMLAKRQELWSQIPDVNNFDDLTRHITGSAISSHIFSIAAAIIIVVFIAGCLFRPCLRRRRGTNYKAIQP